ncbi:MAG: PspA/IM30 family protein [Ichthyobacteriaceae bacterium]|nr:PspA/IM30 family protein [Ichthyobacteriaceae bacterium]
MNIFKRIFNIGTAEAHSAIDKLEDPIKMTEQGIRDLKKDLESALKALAEIKALAIRSRNDYNTSKSKSKDYESKAILLLKRAESGEMEMDQAERLATEALTKKEDFDQSAIQSNTEMEKFENNVSQMSRKISALKKQISTFENELRTLKARVKVSTATKNINKQMSNIDSSSTVSMLERMKDKVAEEEALAEAYGDIANESKSLDDEIDNALAGESSVKAKTDLSALKAKLGMNK